MIFDSYRSQAMNSTQPEPLAFQVVLQKFLLKFSLSLFLISTEIKLSHGPPIMDIMQVGI